MTNGQGGITSITGYGRIPDAENGMFEGSGVIVKNIEDGFDVFVNVSNNYSQMVAKYLSQFGNFVGQTK